MSRFHNTRLRTYENNLVKNYLQICRGTSDDVVVKFVPSSVSMKVHVVCLMSHDTPHLPAESERRWATGITCCTTEGKEDRYRRKHIYTHVV